MTTWEIGATLQFGLKTYSTAGVLADLGGGLPTATITLPTAVTAAGTVTKTATGTYAAATPGGVLGRYLCKWTGTGDNSGGLPYTDTADVLDMSRLIVPMADARAALNIPAATVVNDDELRSYIAAATLIIENICGPVLSATRVESRDGDGRTCLPLYDYPSAITTVVENGTTLTASDYYLDSAGILWRGSTKGAGTWSTTGRTVVTYTVGASTIAPNVLLAAREQVRFLWQIGQQGGRPSLGGEAPGYMSAGYAVPNRVIELLASSMSGKTPGIA